MPNNKSKKQTRQQRKSQSAKCDDDFHYCPALERLLFIHPCKYFPTSQNLLSLTCDSNVAHNAMEITISARCGSFKSNSTIIGAIINTKKGVDIFTVMKAF